MTGVQLWSVFDKQRSFCTKTDSMPSAKENQRRTARHSRCFLPIERLPTIGCVLDTVAAGEGI
jgi:hypothetical protein